MEIYFNNIIFRTKKQFENYIKDLIKNKIGICDSLKNTEYWSMILELSMRHPDWVKKSSNMKDMIIRKSEWGNIEMAILNHDDTITTFSYNTAIKGLPMTKNCRLNMMLREAIKYQIHTYRENNKMICNLCGSMENIEIDHIYPFHKLRDDFLNICKTDKVIIPYDFIQDENQKYIFKEEDKVFENNWKYYHQLNCNLQPLCKKCHKQKSFSKNT